MAHFERTRVGGTKEKQINRSFNYLQSDKIYERVIFDSLSSKNPFLTLNPERKNSTKRGLSTKRSIQSLERMDSSENLDKKKHFNQSICNNFVASRGKNHKLLENMSKTLDII